jgi:hypothetical protein
MLRNSFVLPATCIDVYPGYQFPFAFAVDKESNWVSHTVKPVPTALTLIIIFWKYVSCCCAYDIITTNLVFHISSLFWFWSEGFFFLPIFNVGSVAGVSREHAVSIIKEEDNNCTRTRWLISFWLYKENKQLRDWKNVFTYSPLRFTHLWLRCSNCFNLSKKNYFGFAANRKIGKAKDLSVPLRIYRIWGRGKGRVLCPVRAYGGQGNVVRFVPRPLPLWTCTGH